MRDLYFGGGIATDIAHGQRRYHLKALQFAAFEIPGVGRDGGIQFVANVGPRLGWMECEVAGTGAGAGPCESIRYEFAARNIQPINVNPVEATVGRNEKTAAGIERDIMRVRAGSSLIAVRPDRALRRDH